MKKRHLLNSLMKGNLSQEEWQGEVCIITKKNRFCITSRNGKIFILLIFLSLLLTFLQRSNPNSRTGFLSRPPCFRRKRDGPCSKNNTADEFYHTHLSSNKLCISVEKVTRKCSKPIKTSVPYSTLASSNMNKTVIEHTIRQL